MFRTIETLETASQNAIVELELTKICTINHEDV